MEAPADVTATGAGSDGGIAAKDAGPDGQTASGGAGGIAAAGGAAGTVGNRRAPAAALAAPTRGSRWGRRRRRRWRNEHRWRWRHWGSEHGRCRRSIEHGWHRRASTGGNGEHGWHQRAGASRFPPLFAQLPVRSADGRPGHPGRVRQRSRRNARRHRHLPGGGHRQRAQPPRPRAATTSRCRAPLLQTVTSVTIAVWVNVHTDQTWQRIFDFGSSTNVYLFFSPHAGGTNVARFAITTSGNGNVQRLDAAAVPCPSPPGRTWRSSSSAGGGTLYLNTVRRSPPAPLWPFGRPTSARPLTPGSAARSSPPIRPFNGEIDDLAHLQQRPDGRPDHGDLQRPLTGGFPPSHRDGLPRGGRRDGKHRLPDRGECLFARSTI